MKQHYWVLYKKERLFSSKLYSSPLEWDKPINTEEEKLDVENFICKKRSCRKCKIIAVTPISESMYKQFIQ